MKRKDLEGGIHSGRKGKKKQVLTGIRRGGVALLVVLCLCGCSSHLGFSTYGESKTDYEVTLTFFGNVNATEKIAPIDKLIQQYMEANPDVNIVYEGIDPSMSNDYNELLQKRLSTGNGDDVFFSYAGYLPTLAAGDYLEQLNNLSGWDAYSQVTKDTLTIDGNLYGIPMETTVIGLYCNQDVLNQYQVSVPTTYQELMDACAALKSQGVQPIVSSQLLPFSGYALAQGLSEIQQEENVDEIKKGIASGAVSPGQYFEKGFSHLQAMLDEGYIDREAALASDTTKKAEQQFADGEAAFLLGASDLNVSILANNPSVQYQIYPIPVEGSEGVVMTAPDHLLCVNKNSQNASYAIDFVTFCTQQEHVEAYVKAQGSISPLSNTDQENRWLKPVMNSISQDRQISSVDYRFGIRLQNWVQKAGISMLEGAGTDEAVRLLNGYVAEELKE